MFGNAEANCTEKQELVNRWPLKKKSINTHSHIHTQTHTYTHTNTHARTHTHTHARTHTHTHTNTNTHTYTYRERWRERDGEGEGVRGEGGEGWPGLGACLTFLCRSVHKEKRNASSVTIQLVWHFNEWDFTHRRVWVLIMGSIPYS